MANNFFTLIRIISLIMSNDLEKMKEAKELLESFDEEEIKKVNKFIDKKLLNNFKK